MNARQLCRWAAMQHPDSEIVTRGTGSNELVAVMPDAREPGDHGVSVPGQTSSAFENGEKEKAA